VKTVAGANWNQRDQRSPSGRRKSDSRQPLDFSAHTTIGRFELIRELARGGMGQVFLARDTMLGRKVAIKFLLRDDPTFVQRFLIEARATARCTHENIVTIFEVGEHEGLPYIVLEYLEGKTLSDVLDTKPSLRQFTELMIAVARALERAHEHGIVHRDLKPSNIFVTDRGQVKVLDFGVARVVDHAQAAIERATQEMTAVVAHASSDTFTGSDSIVGTVQYMSPEQWGADVVDHQSDIWAFGILFWRAFGGTHPAGTLAPAPLQFRLRDLDTSLPSLATSGPHIPRELAAIVDRCLEMRKADRYQTAGELVADLQTFLMPKADRATGEVCPFRGLAPFGEDDAKYFFGRTSEIRTALAQLADWPLLAVIGPSGVGKSSFVHAGLVPAMRANGGAWSVHPLRPGRVPLHRLATVLEEATGHPASDLLPQLIAAPGLFGTMLRAAPRRVLVVVDQLEELFTLCDSDEIRRQFLAALLAAADDPSSSVRVVLSMRADFLDRLAVHKTFLAELSRGLFFLTPPDQDNLRETLERPAELAGYVFEDRSIVEDMMQVATSRGALPLLSFAATRLWEARDRQRKLLTCAAYQQMGGVGGAFAQHADRVAAAVPPSSQPLLRAIMTRLVTPEGTRAVVDHAELLSLAQGGDVARILDQLVQARLVQLHTEPDQPATVEIVHEMLITEWPTLVRWLEEGQALRGFLHELRAAARQWAARGKPGDLLWRGATAHEALATARRHVLDLSGVESEYLAAVRGGVRRARRRRVSVLATIFTALGLVIAGGAVAFIRIQSAEQVATEKAAAAEKAQAALQGKLDVIAEKERARLAAEKDMLAARGAEKLSKEELEKANVALTKALTEAKGAQATAEEEQQKAQAEKAKAQAAADVAKKATAEAQAAKTVVEANLREQQKLAADLKKQLDKIYNERLK
jgi:hypothetical protein